MKTTKPLIMASMLLFALPLTAQDKPGPCTDSKYRAFDFWLGEWNVSTYADNKFAGENTVVAIEGGCAITETWNGSKGSTGFSLNFYNPVSQKWRQQWVSSGEYSIDIEGTSKKPGHMALSGTIWYHARNISYPFKGIWTLEDDGSVRQRFLQYDPATDIWKPWFDGKYVRKQQD